MHNCEWDVILLILGRGLGSLQVVESTLGGMLWKSAFCPKSATNER